MFISLYLNQLGWHAHCKTNVRAREIGLLQSIYNNEGAHGGRDGAHIPQTNALTKENSGRIASGEMTPMCYTGETGMNRN